MSDPTSLPIYQQVSERLARDVQAGRLAEGSKLPPEREMAASLGIAVGTLRKALSLLEQQDMLERIQGSGNYIKTPSQPSNIYAFFRLELRSGGGLPTAQMLDIARLPKPADLPGFGTAPDGVRMRRFRKLNDVPAALEEIWLDGDAAGTETPEAVSESLYLFYAQALGLTVTRFEDRLGAAPRPDWGGDHIALPEVTGFAERFTWADGAHPIEYSRTWFHSAKVAYVTRQ